jgi:PAS domain S-box-containing protein
VNAAQKRFDPPPDSRQPGASGSEVMHQMAAQGFRNIFWVVLLVFIFALFQMFLFQQVCKDGMKAARALEYEGLPDLNRLADLREQLALFRLNCYQYMFANESERQRLEQAVNLTRQRISDDLEQIKALHHSAAGRQRVVELEQAIAGLSQTFDQIRHETDKDFVSAMDMLDRRLPAQIQAVNQEADELAQYGYQRSNDQARANFAGFDDIKSKAVIMGTANIAVALGLVLFVLMAARRTHQQLAGALEQIHDQNRRLRLQASALDAANNAIFITDQNCLVQWVNPAFSRLTGYSPGEVIGKHARILRSTEQDLEFYQTMWRTIQLGGVWTGELVSCRKDGSLYHEEMDVTPVRGEDGSIQNFIAIKHDISNRKRFQSELEQEKNLLCSLMDNLPDFIYFKDSESRFTRVNLALTRHLGLEKPEEAIGRTFADFKPWREVRQMHVEEQRMMTMGEPIIGLVEKSETASGTRWFSSTKVPLRDAAGAVTGLVGVSRDITDYKQVEFERREVQNRYRMLFESSLEAILISDEKALLDCNPAALKMFHCRDKSDVIFHQAAEFSPPRQRDGADSHAAIIQHIRAALDRGNTEYEWDFLRQDGEIFPAAVSLTVFQQGAKRLLQATIEDLTEIKRAEKERQLMEVQLRQSQKMESIGQLAAGIAHEINTPTQYIGDNTRFLKDAFVSIVDMMRDYDSLLAAAKTNSPPAEQIARIEAALVSRDIEFLYAQIPTAIQETLEGVDRVSKIVRAMKEFSHPGGKEKSLSDLNKAIESTVTVARNEWKYVADLKLELDPELPLVPCFLGEFNQAILNLLINAAHAIGDVVSHQPGAKGRITIRTQRAGDQVVISVADTGTGIEEKHRAKIFEPFFTTKEVGKGTGQGLTVVYSNIVKKHSGTVTFETEIGRGTTFIIRLPLNPPAATPAEPPPAPQI